MNSTLDDLFHHSHLVESAKKSWALIRLDDNGNEFEMALYDDLETAEVMRRSYEARGHKQTYFLRRK
ncbi:MAG TPA: hypothetical protein VFM46_09430 [Pseudomonadales bacterium]|nr:hypothetical protein [Pseudomonadales bacterium]